MTIVVMCVCVCVKTLVYSTLKAMAFSLSLYPLPLEVVGLPSFLPIPSVCLGVEKKEGHYPVHR